MKFDLTPDNPVTDAACKKASGKTFKEWFAWIEKKWPEWPKRRVVVYTIYEEECKDIWWATTIGVEYERHKEMKKDGLYEGYSICSTKTLNAPMSKVYEAWAKMDEMKKWMDEVGGKMKEGETVTSGAKRKYEVLRLRKDKDLRFDYHDHDFTAVTRIDVMLEDKGKGKCGINVHHKRLQTREEADGSRNTWADAMTRLKSLVEG